MRVAIRELGHYGPVKMNSKLPKVNNRIMVA